MGRIDAVIPEELESKLRMEVVKRLGGKKGDLQRAIEQAIELWINNPIIEGLKATAMNGRLLPNERQRATDALGEVGYPAIGALNEIANYDRLLPNEREKATMIIQKILKEQKLC
jgi:hypothetical protein